MHLAQVFTQNLRALRAEAKLSQETVARETGFSVSYISMLERGRRTPPLQTVEQIAKALKVSPMSMLQDLGAPKHRR